MCVEAEARGQHQVSALGGSSLSLLRQGLSLKLELVNSVTLACK